MASKVAKLVEETCRCGLSAQNRVMQEGKVERVAVPDHNRQRAEAADELAREIKSRRLAAGLSQRELATRIGYTRQYVSMTEWEDANLPSRDLVAAIDAGLDADGELMAIHDRIKQERKVTRRDVIRAGTAGSAGEQSECVPIGVFGPRIHPGALSEAIDVDMPLDREQIGAYLRSQRMSEHAITSLVEVTRMLAGQRQSVAPGALLGPIEAHRDTVSALFRNTSDSRLKERLGSLLGETSIVASRVWSAVGDRAMALSHCAFARKLADSMRDPVIGGVARIFESNLRSDAATLIGSDGDVIIGLRILRDASTMTDRLPPAARARIGAELAQAYAVLELDRECQDALSRAQRAVDDIDEVDRTGLFSDWDASRILVYEGTCWLFLNKPRKAIVALDAALSTTGDGNRNVGLAAQVDLASAYNQIGELEEGCRILGETHSSLFAMGNQRGIERAHRAIERTTPWRNEQPVRALRERIRSTEIQ
ncbi:helix-turn-helix domain-containing protein [Nocardia fusca]|uniref:helix-turn-helix domain-containing protein n=1 Tax=Nocardia fusca TaxID=941183 RepID=UPI000A054F36|nr:helix-turn-helix transcriptional regulator [Nocardia fusca]